MCSGRDRLEPLGTAWNRSTQASGLGRSQQPGCRGLPPQRPLLHGLRGMRTLCLALFMLLWIPERAKRAMYVLVGSYLARFSSPTVVPKAFNKERKERKRNNNSWREEGFYITPQLRPLRRCAHIRTLNCPKKDGSHIGSRVKQRCLFTTPVLHTVGLKLVPVTTPKKPRLECPCPPRTPKQACAALKKPGWKGFMCFEANLHGTRRSTGTPQMAQKTWFGKNGPITLPRANRNRSLTECR